MSYGNGLRDRRSEGFGVLIAIINLSLARSSPFGLQQVRQVSLALLHEAFRGALKPAHDAMSYGVVLMSDMTVWIVHV